VRREDRSHRIAHFAERAASVDRIDEQRHQRSVGSRGALDVGEPISYAFAVAAGTKRREPLALPTEASAKVALRTQQIIAFESGVASTADPLGGSYYVERLTSDLAKAARTIIDEVDARGGSIAAIESGWMQGQIADSAYRAQQSIERGDTIVVGVNKFADPQTGSARVPLQRIDPSIERAQRERLAAFRAGRDGERVANRLADVKRAAESGAPLMPLFVDAVDTGCTLGDVCDAMRAVFSTHRPVVVK